MYHFFLTPFWWMVSLTPILNLFGALLFPYLFILRAKTLYDLLKRAERKCSISSVPLGEGPLKVNHLFFVVDNLLFCNANFLEWSRLVHILKTYEQVLGQMLNKEKTTIFFGPNTPHQEVRSNIIYIVGVRNTGSFEKYLGLPIVLGSNKAKSFPFISGQSLEQNLKLESKVSFFSRQ